MPQAVKQRDFLESMFLTMSLTWLPLPHTHMHPAYRDETLLKLLISQLNSFFLSTSPLISSLILIQRQQIDCIQNAGQLEDSYRNEQSSESESGLQRQPLGSGCAWWYQPPLTTSQSDSKICTVCTMPTTRTAQGMYWPRQKGTHSASLPCMPQTKAGGIKTNVRECLTDSFSSV